MAGYSRHRSVYRLQGYNAMRSELALDMGRLWQRNLVCTATHNHVVALYKKYTYIYIHTYTKYLLQLYFHYLKHICSSNASALHSFNRKY
jgi:hypothetical protein